jgi:hypothetical protein
MCFKLAIDLVDKKQNEIKKLLFIIALVAALHSMLTSAGKQALVHVFELSKHKKNPYDVSSFWQRSSRHLRVAYRNVSESYLKLIVRQDYDLTRN